MTIPKIVHFVFGFDEQTTEFPLMFYIAILSAKKVLLPDTINFHYYHEPYGPWWDKALEIVTLRRILHLPTHWGKKPILKRAHKADHVRMNVLHREGGIYLDIDTICVRPVDVDDLLTESMVLGEERPNPWNSELSFLGNSVMMAEPGAPFLTEWLKRYEENFISEGWIDASVILPGHIAHELPSLITILPRTAFFYPGCEETDLIWNSTVTPDVNATKELRILHLWHSMERHPTVTREMLIRGECYYARLARPLLLDLFPDIGLVNRIYIQKHPYRDVFQIKKIYKGEDRARVHLTRTDVTEGWGQDLVLLVETHEDMLATIVVGKSAKHTLTFDICLPGSFAPSIARAEHEDLRVYPIVTFNTPYGLFSIYHNDMYIARPFYDGGYFDEEACLLLRAYIDPAKDILEIGAHCGTHTLIYNSFLAPESHLYAFEPQKNLYALLVKNIAQNNITNVVPSNKGLFCYQGTGSMNNTDVDGAGGAVSSRYTREVELPCNFGGISLGDDGEAIELTTVDNLGLNKLGFIHCDAQGSENYIFAGAVETIARCRPVIYYEDNEKHGQYLVDIVDKVYAEQYPEERRFSLKDYCLKTLGYSNCIERFNGSFDSLLIP